MLIWPGHVCAVLWSPTVPYLTASVPLPTILSCVPGSFLQASCAVARRASEPSSRGCTLCLPTGLPGRATSDKSMLSLIGPSLALQASMYRHPNISPCWAIKAHCTCLRQGQSTEMVNMSRWEGPRTLYAEEMLEQDSRCKPCDVINDQTSRPTSLRCTPPHNRHVAVALQTRCLCMHAVRQACTDSMYSAFQAVSAEAVQEKQAVPGGGMLASQTGIRKWHT